MTPPLSSPLAFPLLCCGGEEALGVGDAVPEGVLEAEGVPEGVLEGEGILEAEGDGESDTEGGGPSATAARRRLFRESTCARGGGSVVFSLI